MRVIAGWLGGQNFEAPHGHRTHPMSEKVRGAIFGVLGDIKGLSVLDVFAGSGAIAIEAVSRGAASAVAIEADKGAHTVIVNNIAKLGIEDRMTAVKAYAGAWSTRHQNDQFDLVFLDPPYDKELYREIENMPRHLKPDGTLVLSWPGKDDPGNLPRFKDLQIVQRKDYGDAQLVFYQRS